MKPKCIATAFLANTITANGQDYLNFNGLNIVGSGLSLSEGGLKVGQGISKVTVTGQVFAYRSGAHYDWWGIRINKYEMSVSISDTSSGYASVCFTPMLAKVQENDLFQIMHYVNESGWEVRGGGNTYLTVTAYE